MMLRRYHTTNINQGHGTDIDLAIEAAAQAEITRLKAQLPKVEASKVKTPVPKPKLPQTEE